MAKKAAESPQKQKRKSKRSPAIIDYDKVESLAGRGLSKAEIALCLGFTVSWLMKRQKVDKRFLAAMEKGKAAAIAAVTAKLFQHIQGGNVTSIIFFLKCRAGWKETSVVETRDLPPLLPENCSPEEAEAAYIAAMRGA